MNKVGFFKSIHFKFALIYILLILVAMQVIGVYFVRKLENYLEENFTISISERTKILIYSIEQEMVKDRTDKNAPLLEEDIQRLLQDFTSDNFTEVQVIDNKSRIIGTSNPYKKVLVGKRTTEVIVKRTLLGGSFENKKMVDPNTGEILKIFTFPVRSNNEIIGAVYVSASMKNVYNQMEQINGILATGTVIALIITAGLGILLARTITRPMSDMRKQALAMARGDFSRKVKIYGRDEIGQLAFTFNNLTQKLKKAQLKTEEERKKLSSVLAHMTDGVIAADSQGLIILMNDQAEKMLHVSRETVIGQSLLSILPIEHNVSVETIYQDNESIQFDLNIGEDDQSIIRANFSVIQNDIGQPNGFITVLYDVTEQETIEQERREFVANVSHELRTPLTTMKSYLEALADGALSDPEIAPRFLHVTQKETERMIRLVSDLLQLSKLDNRELSLQVKHVNFTEFFHKIIDRFEIAKDQHVTLVRRFPKRDLYVKIDEDRITQVIDNIISNAMKYSPEGGAITFKLLHQGSHIKISIRDQGIGIPKENLSRVFERFYRVDKARARKFGGTGLGLAIAKEIITLHGGKIWAESEENKGTAINFTLPIDRDRGGEHK